MFGRIMIVIITAITIIFFAELVFVCSVQNDFRNASLIAEGFITQDCYGKSAIGNYEFPTTEATGLWKLNHSKLSQGEMMTLTQVAMLREDVKYKVYTKDILWDKGHSHFISCE